MNGMRRVNGVTICNIRLFYMVASTSLHEIIHIYEWPNHGRSFIFEMGKFTSIVFESNLAAHKLKLDMVNPFTLHGPWVMYNATLSIRMPSMSRTHKAQR